MINEIEENGTVRIRNWASQLDDNARDQALRTSRLPIMAGPIALQADAHWGNGSTVGSVLATDGAIVPSAVGSDIGCGMCAVRLSVKIDRLPDDLNALSDDIERSVPMGMGRGTRTPGTGVTLWMNDNPTPTPFSQKQTQRAISQMGSLGGGNHFLEVCADDEDFLWVMLHSGSRGIGHMLANDHIGRAKKLAEHLEIALEDPELAWFVQGTPEFEAYIEDMLWAQAYAQANRDFMMNAALWQVVRVTGGEETLRVNVHHNYANLEEIDGKPLWITRKGATSARAGELGIIPGSMATGSYIVEGLGNPLSYYSCPHGAGRRMSRGDARRQLSMQDFVNAMDGKTWQLKDAEDLLDEAPPAYKSIESVMKDSIDLVTTKHHLTQLINLKGVEKNRRRRGRR